MEKSIYDKFTRFVQFMNQMRMSGNHIDLTQIPEQYLTPKEKMAQMSGQIYSKIETIAVVFFPLV